MRSVRLGLPVAPLDGRSVHTAQPRPPAGLTTGRASSGELYQVRQHRRTESRGPL